MGNKIILQMPVGNKPFLEYGQMSLFVTELNRVLNQMLSANDDLPYRNPNLPTVAEKAWVSSSVAEGGAIVQPGTVNNDILMWNATTQEWENKLRTSFFHANLGGLDWVNAAHTSLNGVTCSVPAFSGTGVATLAVHNISNVDPGATNDYNHDYRSMISHWRNSVSGDIFICTDDTNDAAVWKKLT